jgi:hypothetical protein
MLSKFFTISMSTNFYNFFIPRRGTVRRNRALGARPSRPVPTLTLRIKAKGSRLSGALKEWVT